MNRAEAGARWATDVAKRGERRRTYVCVGRVRGRDFCREEPALEFDQSSPTSSKHLHN